MGFGHSSHRRTAACALSVFAVIGCGAGTPDTVTMPRQGELDSAAFLRAYAAEHTTTFAAPSASIEELDAERREARGDERRAAMRALAIAHLLAAEDVADDREARKHRRDALRFAGHAARGSRDDYLKAEMDFVELWSAWRAERRGASRVAERFTRRHLSSGDLLVLAWLIRGEIDLGAERHDDARTSYRYVLGLIEHPLYAFALYRTASSHQAAGEMREARDALHEVRQLACADEVAPEIEEIALRAATELRTAIRTDPDGRRRPETCPAPAAADAE
jgi:hypothetical protein